FDPRLVGSRHADLDRVDARLRRALDPKVGGEYRDRAEYGGDADHRNSLAPHRENPCMPVLFLLGPRYGAFLKIRQCLRQHDKISCRIGYRTVFATVAFRPNGTGTSVRGRSDRGSIITDSLVKLVSHGR